MSTPIAPATPDADATAAIQNAFREASRIIGPELYRVMTLRAARAAQNTSPAPATATETGDDTGQPPVRTAA